MYYSTTYTAPVGEITIACNESSLVGLWLKGQKYFGRTVNGQMVEKDNAPIFKAAKEWLDTYFSGGKPAVSALPLAPAGSGFQQTIWKLLCEIPYGEVVTYGELAQKAAVKMNRTSMSAQAVGGAVGHNPISIIIPCHRVIGANGSLTGYAGGIQTKITLLQLEGVDMSRMFVPKRGTAL